MNTIQRMQRILYLLNNGAEDLSDIVSHLQNNHRHPPPLPPPRRNHPIPIQYNFPDADGISPQDLHDHPNQNDHHNNQNNQNQDDDEDENEDEEDNEENDNESKEEKDILSQVLQQSFEEVEYKETHIDPTTLGWLVSKPYSSLPLTDRTVHSRCCICLNDYTDTDNVSCLPCHHWFHTSCIHQFLTKYSHRCPMCRSDVSKKHGHEECTSISIPSFPSFSSEDELFSFYS